MNVPTQLFTTCSRSVLQYTEEVKKLTTRQLWSRLKGINKGDIDEDIFVRGADEANNAKGKLGWFTRLREAVGFAWKKFWDKFIPVRVQDFCKAAKAKLGMHTEQEVIEHTGKKAATDVSSLIDDIKGFQDDLAEMFRSNPEWAQMDGLKTIHQAVTDGAVTDDTINAVCNAYRETLTNPGRFSRKIDASGTSLTVENLVKSRLENALRKQGIEIYQPREGEPVDTVLHQVTRTHEVALSGLTGKIFSNYNAIGFKGLKGIIQPAPVQVTAYKAPANAISAEADEALSHLYWTIGNQEDSLKNALLGKADLSTLAPEVKKAYETIVRLVNGINQATDDISRGAKLFEELSTCNARIWNVDYLNKLPYNDLKHLDDGKRGEYPPVLKAGLVKALCELVLDPAKNAEASEAAIDCLLGGLATRTHKLPNLMPEAIQAAFGAVAQAG